VLAFATVMVIALSSFAATFGLVLVFFVIFPVLVQGLIAYAVIVARGEKRQNEEYRRRRLEG
jgi:Sec-independent protein secretion pathway component TatC